MTAIVTGDRPPTDPRLELVSDNRRSPVMNRHLALAGRAAGRGVFKGTALIGAFLIIVGAWWWDASLLTTAADGNLRLIKTATGFLPVDWGSKVESALRIFGADRALLLVEGITIAKIVMLGIAHPFRRRRP